MPTANKLNYLVSVEKRGNNENLKNTVRLLLALVEKKEEEVQKQANR